MWLELRNVFSKQRQYNSSSLYNCDCTVSSRTYFLMTNCTIYNFSTRSIALIFTAQCIFVKVTCNQFIDQDLLIR